MKRHAAKHSSLLDVTDRCNSRRAGQQRDMQEGNQKRTEGTKRALEVDEFVKLLLTHESRVRGFVVSLMFGIGDVDDVFQSACLAAFRKLDSFAYSADSPDDEFVRWICTIARYEVLQVLRKRRTDKVTISSELVVALADMQLNKSNELGARAIALAECIERLSYREKDLLKMRYGRGMSVAEIASRLSRTANGIYKALERVRSQLFACISSKLRMEGDLP